MVSFNECFDRLIDHEGGYTNSPNDPGNYTGGKIGVGVLLGTKWGIAANTYPTVDIKNLTRMEAKTIYKRDFWDVVDGNNLPDGVAFQLFDFAVNSGSPTAIRYFQRSLNLVEDGVFGPKSRAKALATSEVHMIMGILSERLIYMADRSNWNTAGRGWVRRIARNLKFGILDS